MNHVSNMDSVVFAAYFKNEFRFVYKAEFDEKPFLRHIFHNMRLIPVKRGEVDLKATKECLSALKQNEILFIFPEGTRNRESDEMLPFKTGPATTPPLYFLTAVLAASLAEGAAPAAGTAAATVAAPATLNKSRRLSICLLILDYFPLGRLIRALSHEDIGDFNVERCLMVFC